MVTPGVVSAGVTEMDEYGFPSHCDPTAHPVMCPSNVDMRRGGAAQVTEFRQGRVAGEPTLAVLTLRAYFPRTSQLDLRREIVSRLPEHWRCVLPPEQDD